MISKATNKNLSATGKRWMRPELARLGTMSDVAAQKPSNNIQGNFT
jgi:hypothetical protein